MPLPCTSGTKPLWAGWALPMVPRWLPPDRFQVRIVGKGGHGAQPQATEDPVLAASQVVTALQSIVSRHVDPLEAAVVSVTMFQAGTAFNIIPTDARLEGTIRTFEPAVTREVRTRFRRIVHGVAQAMGCRAEVDLDLLTPAVINDARIAAVVRAAAAETLPDVTIDAHARTMGSEDMSLMMYDIPGCYFFVGSNNPAKGLDAPHHHPRFDFDEAALPRGVAVMSAAVVKVLEERPA